MNNKELKKNLEKERKKQIEDAIKINTFIRLHKSSASEIDKLLESAIHKQCKELGWLEEKQETNLEHYYNDILKLNGSFSLINGKIGICQGICCSRCAFNKDYCQVGRVEWLKQPYKKPTYKLNKFEYDLINTFDRCKECCLLNEIECLKKLKEKGYFKGIDPFTKVHEILDNCKVIE